MWGQFENLQSFLKMAATPPPPTPSQVIKTSPLALCISTQPLSQESNPTLGSNFGYKMKLFLVVLSFVPQLSLFVANWFASSQMGFLLVILTTICFLLFFLWARNANCWNTSIIVSPKSA